MLCVFIHLYSVEVWCHFSDSFINCLTFWRLEPNILALEAIETKGSLTIENMHHVLHYTEVYQESLYLCKDILGRTGKVNCLFFFFNRNKPSVINYTWTFWKYTLIGRNAKLIEIWNQCKKVNTVVLELLKNSLQMLEMLSFIFSHSTNILWICRKILALCMH